MLQKKIMLSLFMLLLLVLTSFAVLAQDDAGYIKATFLNQDPDPAVPGDYVELRWKIDKVGVGLIEDIEFELIPSYPFTFDQSDSSVKSIGSLSGFIDEDEQYVLYYKLYVDSLAKEDDYSIKLKTTSSQNGVATSQISTYDILVNKKESSSFVVGTVTSSPLELFADTTDNKLSIDIENIGDGLAKEVVAQLTLPSGMSPSYGYATRSVLGSIPSDSGKSATFYIDLDEFISSGTYNTSIVLQYADESDDDNTYRQFVIPVDIPVHAKPSFSLDSVRLVPSEIHVGTNVKVYFTVTNIGEKEASGVSLRAFKESSQPFDFSDNSDFIGTLKSGSSADAVLEFTVEEGANFKDYLVDLEIRGIYQDEVFVDDATASIIVSEGNESGSSSFIVPVIMLLVGLVFGYFIAKRSRSKK